MMARELVTLWDSVAAALGNHLWQSTVFAVAIGALTLSLRNNHARARYWLWLAASLKFLIPFSWLEAAGARLAWVRGASAGGGLSVVIEEVSRPFAGQGIPKAAVGAAAMHSSFLHWGLPPILVGIWFCGFLAVIAVWCVRWRRIAVAIRESERSSEGREVETLRRLEAALGIRPRVEMRISRTMLEPGVFGIVRPKLIWPRGISECLDDGHLQAVLSHELWHVRRRDNLAAALHMIVEAVFWFHPLVWWLGARLVDERERACDEQVLELGSQRNVYAESILKVCQFCVGSPLACVSGVTGSDLKKRMVHIMSEGMVRKLDFGRKILLTAAALMAFAAPVTVGLLTATPSGAQASSDNSDASAKFESVSIKPSVINTPTYAGGNVHMVRMMVGPAGFSARNVTLRSLIQEAYGVQANQVLGGPEWLDTAAFDIEGKTGQPENQEFKADQAPFEKSVALNHRMLQNLLADRAKLALHKETRVLPSYELVVAGPGSKLQASPSKSGDLVLSDKDIVLSANGKPMGAHQMMMNVNENKVRAISAHEVTTDEIAQQLSRALGVHVVNQTGLKGSYDFNLHWLDGAASGDDETASTGTSEPSLFTAVQEQLGLRLQPQDRPTEVLIVDHVEKPGEE
jgi:bla regulator protein BlaR1